jgi:CubicO group peptidase (beta-lactamase class C family)
MTFRASPSFGDAHLWSRRKVTMGIAVAASSVAAPAFFSHAAPQPAMPSASTGSCHAPLDIEDGLNTAASAETGVDPAALCTALDSVRNGSTNIHSVLVARRGKIIAELYCSGSDRSIYSLWSSRVDFHQAEKHDMRSISKNVVSLLYGILLARGEVPDIETPVASLYSEYPELNDAPRQAIRIRHLLTMTTGLEWNEPSPVYRASSNDETGLLYRECAYRYVFDRDVVAPPGYRFAYSGGATAVLAEIMVRTTKKPLCDLAREELFEPLGITDWEWIKNLHGTPLAAAGLRMKPRDLMKIGVMMLDRGRWQGRQVVPAAWIAQSTKPHIMTDPVGGYGFQWWSISTPRQGKELAVTAAIGNGGQRLFLVPDLDLSVVTTAGDYNDPAISGPLNQILQQIVGAIQN